MWKIGLLVLLSAVSASGGFERQEIGARRCGMGCASTASCDDVWAIAANVGGLAGLSSGELSVFHNPQPFGLSELSLSAAEGAIPFSLGTIGVGVRRYGFELYREMTGTLAYARNVSSIHCGISLNYYTVSIKNYGTAGAVGINVGLVVLVLKTVHWGASVMNLNAPTIGRSHEPLPQSFATGVCYAPVEGFCLNLDLQKESTYEVSTRLGAEFWIVDAVAIRAGVMDTPAQYTTGLGIRYSFIQIDYAFVVHEDLGGSHMFSVTIH